MPILIHGGRGLPPIADHLARLVDAYPDAQLIIAHAGIADLSGLAGHFAGKAGVFFDTSVWSPIDLLSFFRLVPPEQILYASDYPYGQQPQSLLIALRTARVAGLTRAADRRDARREREPDRRTASRRSSRRSRRARTCSQQPMTLARIHQYLSMAMPLALRAPAGHVRRARPRAQRDERAQRARRGARPDPRAARRRARALAHAAGGRGRRRRARRSRARRRGSSISPTSWR